MLPEAFDIAQEPEYIHEMYGLNRDDSKDYGRQCLLARRLIERGVRFVQVFASVPKRLAAELAMSPGMVTAISSSITALVLPR